MAAWRAVSDTGGIPKPPSTSQGHYLRAWTRQGATPRAGATCPQSRPVLRLQRQAEHLNQKPLVSSQGLREPISPVQGELPSPSVSIWLERSGRESARFNPIQVLGRAELGGSPSAPSL